MPCQDITEVIELRLDGADRLVSYRLNKRTCGAEIGQQSLLLPWVAGVIPETVLDLEASSILDAANANADEEFLYIKHLVALQEALKVLIGAASDAPRDLCTPCAITADADGVTFEGLISIQAVTTQIKSCGNCGSCGSHRKPKLKVPLVAQGPSET
jgi:hypothetical protein